MSRTGSLLVLGAGEDQLPAYVEGRRLGLRVIGVDQRPDAIAARAADEFLCMTTRDPEAIARRLGRVDVAAVISPASDAAQPSVAALSDIYSTPFRPAPPAVRASVDKVFFRTVVEGLGFPRYEHVQGVDPAALAAAADGLGLPVVVKPIDSSGSKGLHHVADPAFLRDAIDVARKYSPSGQVIVEQAVSGRHCSAECFVHDGRLELMILTDRTLTLPPSMISVSHEMPAELDDEPGLRRMIEAILAALEHRSGPVNLDFVVAPDGAVHFIEMGARLGGNGMPMLAREALGVNTVERAIRMALGEPFDLTPTRRRVALLHIIASPTDGVLTAVAGLVAARALPHVVALDLFAGPGDRVHRYTQAAHKLGYLVLAADTRAELLRGRDEALATLRLPIDPDDRTEDIA